MGIKLMADNGSQRFKIRFDDEAPFEVNQARPSVRERAENLRLRKLSRRLNLFMVLMICLLTLTILFVYFDSRYTGGNFQFSGLSDVQSLSSDLDSKFSSLSIRQAKLEALLNEKMAAIEKTAAGLAKNLDQTEKAIADIRSSAPAKQDFAEVTAEMDKRLDPVAADLKKLSSEIKQTASDTKMLQDRLDKESGKLAAAISGLQKEVSVLKTEAEALSTARVDKQTFDLTIRHEERFFQQKLAELENSLSEKIASLSSLVGTLEEQMQKSASPSAAPRSPAPPSPSAAENTKPPAPEPGKILEQELQR